MSNATLLRRVKAIEKRLDPPQEPRQYIICLEEGEALSEELKAQLGPHDTVIIRRYPKGFLGEADKSASGQVMSRWVNGPHGQKKPLLIRQYGVDISKV